MKKSAKKKAQATQKQFRNTETQMISMVKKAIKQSHDEVGHRCQFSNEDVRLLKELISMVEDSKSTLKKVIIKVVWTAIILGVIALFGDKVKTFFRAMYNVF